MTKKDYEAIAGVLLDNKQDDWPYSEVYANIVEAMSRMLARDNPRFDWQQFHDACYGITMDRE